MEMVDKWIPIAIPLAVGLWLTLKIGSSVAMFAEPRGSTPLETLNIASQTWLQYASMLFTPVIYRCSMLNPLQRLGVTPVF